jgi:hypothetical protein
MQPAEVVANRELLVFKNAKKILCGGFQQFLVADAVKGMGLHPANVTDLGRLLAMCLNPIHDSLPGTLHESRVTRCEVGAGDLHIQGRLAGGLIFGMEQGEGLALALGAKT